MKEKFINKALLLLVVLTVGFITLYKPNRTEYYIQPAYVLSNENGYVYAQDSRGQVWAFIDTNESYLDAHNVIQLTFEKVDSSVKNDIIIDVQPL